MVALAWSSQALDVQRGQVSRIVNLHKRLLNSRIHLQWRNGDTILPEHFRLVGGGRAGLDSKAINSDVGVLTLGPFRSNHPVSPAAVRL
jgi:hypothetical protein